jgi:hypothetical protein
MQIPILNKNKIIALIHQSFFAVFPGFSDFVFLKIETSDRYTSFAQDVLNEIKSKGAAVQSNHSNTDLTDAVMQYRATLKSWLSYLQPSILANDPLCLSEYIPKINRL